MSEKSLPIVSRETMGRLEAFDVLVRKWTEKINLISAKDVDLIWNRHIVDSIQIFETAPDQGKWLDIGSGGGFPGIVAAILSREKQPARPFTLVDSDQRKCVFLRTAARELDLNVRVSVERIEKMPAFGADVLTARALGDLNSILSYAERHLAAGGTAIFPKGARWKQEHIEAQKFWSYSLEVVESRTNPDATILKIREPKRV